MFSSFKLTMGALTSKPYAFSTRPWEIESALIVDPQEPLGTPIRVDSRNGVPFRILPANTPDKSALSLFHKEGSTEWIADRSRFLYDGFRRQRLVQPLARVSRSDSFKPVSWESLLSSISRLGPTPVLVGGPFLNLETISSLKEISSSWNLRSTGVESSLFDFATLFRSSSSNFVSPDLLLFVGGGLRVLSPLFHLRVQRKLRQGVRSISIGGSALTGGLQLSRRSSDLLRLAQGRHRALQFILGTFQPLIFLAHHLSGRPDYFSIVRILQSLPHRNIISLPLTWGAHNSSIVGISFPVQSHVSKPSWCWLLSADSWAVDPKISSVLYHGHHGDHGASVATLLFPVLAPHEESAPYSTCDVFCDPLPPSIPLPAVESLPTAREAVITVGLLNSVDSLSFERAQPSRFFPVGSPPGSSENHVDCSSVEHSWSRFGRLLSSPIYPAVVNPYQLNSIARASRPLSLASNRLLSRSPSYNQLS